MGHAIALLAPVLQALTVWSAARAVWTRRDRHRFDIVALLAILLLVRQSWTFGSVARSVLFASLPFLTAQLVSHFRHVPRRVLLTMAAVPLVVGASLPVLPEGPAGVFGTLVNLYVGSCILPSAVVMVLESRGSRGVKARRLLLAAGGITCIAITSVIASVVGPTSVQFRFVFADLMRIGNNVALILFYLAFATPRWLVGRWRRAEQASYLAQVAEREPEERGWLAAEDLVDGAQRCVGGSLALVARPRSAHSDQMVVSAATDRELVGMVFARATGLLANAVESRVASLGRFAECGPQTGAHLQKYGSSVLVAPIVAKSKAWGVVIAVHRRGALFPEDDLSMLAQLGRNAAITLDHAALIVERRDQARLASDRRLRELESRVGLMLDSIKDYAILVLDVDGVVAAWHLGAQHVFGHTRDQIASQSGASLFDMTPEAFAAWLGEAETKGMAEREGYCRRFDGSSFTGVTTIRPLVADAGSPPGFVVVTRDVTERRGLEERLRQGQKMQAIGQLAGGVAHDFNNLLTAILGYSDWLERDLAGDRRVEQVIEIQRAAERAADLTRQLLAFSRRQIVRPVSLDLNRLVQEILPMLRRLMAGQIDIVDATAVGTSAVLGDRSQIEQIVLNLVVNARDAMPQGGRITIRTGLVQIEGDSRESGRHDPHVLLEVTDTGVGMDAETKRRAFEPFFTTKEVGRGTGLGLATVYGIVQQMSGLIEVDSEPGRGTSFRLYLPQCAEQPSQTDRPEPQRFMTGRETVLLVEDDDALRTYLVHVLECHGYRVIAAEGAESALAATSELTEPLDLVISDVVMPGMTGPELVAELLHDRPGLPALYMSGYSEGGLPRDISVPRPGHLLQKPFSSTDLLAKVRQILTTV